MTGEPRRSRCRTAAEPRILPPPILPKALPSGAHGKFDPRPAGSDERRPQVSVHVHLQLERNGKAQNSNTDAISAVISNWNRAVFTEAGREGVQIQAAAIWLATRLPDSSAPCIQPLTDDACSPAK